MHTTELMVKTFDREFFGPSFNGQALLPLINSLRFSQVMDVNTWEGYRIVDVILHVAYWKFTLLDFLGEASKCDPPPFALDNYLKASDGFSETDWAYLVAWLQAIHSLASKSILEIPPEQLSSDMPGLECTLEEFLTWLITHDTYHCAMIRNMGVNGLHESHKPGA
jgi:hypothetical protein